jgi:acyl-CoA reductase-like NAD-dependent aldehyde dehydrogenase
MCGLSALASVTASQRDRRSSDFVCTSRQNLLIETHAARQQAEAMLKSLLQAHAECEAQLVSEKRTDPVRTVTGKSSLETAIETTKRMIEALDRAVEEAREIEGETDGGSQMSITVRPAMSAVAVPSGRYRFG